MPAPGSVDLQQAQFTLIKRRHFVPVEGSRSCTLDIFNVHTGLTTGTAARVRYFDEAVTGEVPEGWRKPVTLRLPQDDDAYISKFIERFAEQKLSAGYKLCMIKNRDTEVRCRVAEETNRQAAIGTSAGPTAAADQPAARDSKVEPRSIPRAAPYNQAAPVEEPQDRQTPAEAGPACFDPLDPSRSVKKDISINVVACYFHLPIHMAADALKVGETWLKQKCREHDIKRWPFRKVKSIEKSMEKIFAAVQSTKDQIQLNEMHKSLEELQRHRTNICLGQPRANHPGEVDKPVLPPWIQQVDLLPTNNLQSRSPSPTSTLAKRRSPEPEWGQSGDSAPPAVAIDEQPAKRHAPNPDHFQPDASHFGVNHADPHTIDVADLFSYEDALDLMC